MGPHQTKKFLHSKRNHEQNKPKQNQTHRYRGQVDGGQRGQRLEGNEKYKLSVRK